MQTTQKSPFDPWQEISDVLQTVADLGPSLRAAGLPDVLGSLVVLRASQMNGCTYCVDMHVREGLAAGVPPDKLHRVAAWRHAPDFSPAERAALAWTEALTRIGAEADTSAERAEVLRHFSHRQTSALAATIAIINFWNRINIARH
ncbi:MAG: carboxymuconolactone decarboxylase family protein [Planctomycetota bacterium]